MNPPQNRPAPEPAQGINWKALPWALMLLGALLLTSQFLNSGQGPQAALVWYETSGLRKLEWDNYLSWLRFNGQAEQSRALEQQLREGNPHPWGNALLSEQFVTDSDARATDFWSSSQIQQWKTLREQAPQQLEQSPLYRWGLAAADPRPSRFFTAPFTGGTLWLTLLALTCLALVAQPLERQLGPGRLAVIWLAGSVLSGAGYLLATGPGQIPLHGAAPALMAILAAAAALSRKAIAITLPRGKQEPMSLNLPAWSLAFIPLALLIALTLGQPPMIANLSAGLLAAVGGALLALVLQPRGNQILVSETDTALLPPEQQQTMANGWDALGRLDGNTAERHFREVLNSDPQQFDALTGLFIAQQMQQPVQEAWHDTATTLFAHPADDIGQATQIAQHWKQYPPADKEALPEKCAWQLVITLTQAGEYLQAEKLAARFAEISDKPDNRQNALTVLREALIKEGLKHRADALKV